MQLTVIVPVFNGAEFLKDNISSLQAQTYTEFEVVFIDDGSVDNSSEILKATCLVDSRFKYIKKENGGIASAIQTGIDQAKNDYIVWMDQDDIAVPERLEKTVEAFLTGSELVMGKYEVVNEVLDSTGRIISFPDYVTNENFLLEEIKRNYILGSALAFKKFDGLSIFQRSGGTTDIDLTLKFLLSGRKFTYIPDVLIKYRTHNSNVSANYTNTKSDFKNVMSQYSYQYLQELLLKRGFTHKDINLSLGVMFLFIEEFNQAENCLNEAKKQIINTQSKEFIEVTFYLAVLKFDKKEIEAALQLLQNLIKVSNNLSIHNNLGVCAIALGDFDKGLKHFSYCKELNEDFQDATNNYRLCVEKCDQLESYSFTKRLMRETIIHAHIKQ